jgi:hypothetical protein
VPRAPDDSTCATASLASHGGHAWCVCSTRLRGCRWVQSVNITSKVSGHALSQARIEPTRQQMVRVLNGGHAHPNSRPVPRRRLRRCHELHQPPRRLVAQPYLREAPRRRHHGWTQPSKARSRQARWRRDASQLSARARAPRALCRLAPLDAALPTAPPAAPPCRSRTLRRRPAATTAAAPAVTTLATRRVNPNAEKSKGEPVRF